MYIHMESRFHTCFRTIAKFRHLFELFILLALGLISFPQLLVRFFSPTYLFNNHHLVFLIGNAIIVMLFLLCRRQNDATDDFYDDYIKHSVSSAPVVTDQPLPAEEDAADHDHDHAGKQIEIVVCMAMAPCENMSATIEKARRQIKRFERTQSEKLKREIRLRRSETFERLSSEEFQRRIDAFIDENWKTRNIKWRVDE